MDSHARGALAVCLLLAGCQSAMFPSFGRLNRSAETPSIASSRTAPDAAPGRIPRSIPDTSGGGVRPVSYDQARAADNRRQSIADALEQARQADVRGQHEVARTHYHRVLVLDPAHADAHHALGILADKQGDYRTAETHYLRALRTKPEDANLLSDLGYSYFLQARRHDAEWYLREGLKFDPAHAKARGNLELLFNEQKAFETYRQLLGEQEAVARMGALFPQSPAATRTAAATAHPAAYRPDEPAPGGSGTRPADYRQTHTGIQNASAWPGSPTNVQAAQRTAMDSLRAEMERERSQAAAARHQYDRGTLTAPPVAADAFSSDARDPAGWPGAARGAAPAFGPAPDRSWIGQPSTASAFDAQYAREASGRGAPQQFSPEPGRAPVAPAPYGQWLEQPSRPSAGPSYSSPPGATGAGPEPWPHAPSASWDPSSSPAQPGSAAGVRPTGPAAGDPFYGDPRYPTSAQSAGAPPSFTGQTAATAHPSDVHHAAQRIGMEGGSLFATLPQDATASPATRHPAASGVAHAVAASVPASDNAASWRGPAGVQTADAWEQQSPAYYPQADGWPTAAPPFGGRPQILITPGTSSTAPRASATAPDWQNQGYAPPAGSAAPAVPAGTSGSPSYWQQDPRVTGWNGQ
ncbi:MAG TPA: tetratricopeptide repeat protein [Planctomycetaceae bacterium]|nr:tetratricopeptide repeat protein [Planctomycetaceae bacterium]